MLEVVIATVLGSHLPDALNHPHVLMRPKSSVACGFCHSGGHIPYRDSKLTRILQPSLGGNAKTAIICAVTPAAVHADESHSTLRFACRAKRVVNNATVNAVLSDAAVLKRQAREIEELRRVLDAAGAGCAHLAPTCPSCKMSP